ncbi:MAG: hypothetical protein ACYTAF_06355 [Planctomycetota bacterium]|jgi:hypothetical protein
MALGLRLAGWAIFLAGVIIMVLHLDVLKYKILGMIIAGIGMICTMSCNLVASYAELKRRKREIEPTEPLTKESADRAREIIRKRAERPDPGPEPSPPSGPAKPD